MCKFVRMPFVSGLGAFALLTGCGSATRDPASCSVTLAGDTSESATLAANCGALTTAADAGAAGYVLTLQARTSHVARLTLLVPIGENPAPGAVSSETVSDWSATAVVGGDSTCTYIAGSAGVPTGSFSVTLTSVDLAGGVAHGTAEATLYVHAPLFTDCGPSDIERVAFAF